MFEGHTAADSPLDWRREDGWRKHRMAALQTPLVVAMTGAAATDPGGGQPASRDVSVARSLLDRDDLLQMLDRAVGKRVTVISAPAGSGKTSLLRAWVDRSTDVRRVASVSVARDEQDAQRFWCSILDALRGPAA